ncbi:SET domain-containing protein 8 [Elsinoe fawcettii]|nr:SET domain-containing protein 8 [Elsinoe fawcettii]
MDTREPIPGLDADEVVMHIASIIREQLQHQGQTSGSLSLDDLRNGTLRLEGFLSSGAAEPRQIHLGTVDFSQIDSPNFPPSAIDSHNTSPILTTSLGNASLLDNSHSQSGIRARALRRSPSSTSASSDEQANDASTRRKATGGLRVKRGKQSVEELQPSPPGSRQMDSSRSFPQRKKPKSREILPAMQPTSVAKLVNGVWEQIYGGIKFDLAEIFGSASLEWRDRSLIEDNVRTGLISGQADLDYSQMNTFCKKVTQASRCTRALEVIVQARWVECFDARIQQLLRENLDLSLTRVKMLALKEAYEDFGWTEKEMRNKMAVWRGYKELKDAGGWAILVFAGMGIYRFCKYRGCFTESTMRELARLKSKFEVAADTIHPNWRQLLTVVAGQTERRYHGHPHDWVVSDSDAPVPLKNTYIQWDPHFHFQHLDQCIIDGDAWGDVDPRALTMGPPGQTFLCSVCGEFQSDDHQANGCQCYPSVYGTPRHHSPTQIFRTNDGRNNGLVANLPFERGEAVGEFTGLITRNLRDKDVMQGQTGYGRYQIYQGNMGNFTKFVNHSCVPNSQFERFNWLGTQRIVLVSKGVDSGEEITVDYSDEYWRHLDKECLCGHPSCRYQRRGSGTR